MGKTVASVTMMATAAFLPGLMSGPPAQAQDSGARTATYSGGRSTSPTPSCPAVEWHIPPVPRGVAGNINGVAYYTGMRGTSTITRTVMADGTITSTLTSISGNGPAGNVAGRRDNNISHVELRGAGHAIAKFDPRRWPRIGGGGG
jgi:hypothetical protein